MKAYDITKIGLILLIIAMLVFMMIKDSKQPEIKSSSNTEILQEIIEQDALMKEVRSLRFKVDSVKQTVTASDAFLHSMDANYQENFRNLQKLRNEKFTIPSATIREQYDVITTAKYTEY